MEPYKDDKDLIAELREARPTPAPEFAAELDERAAAGFPRRRGQAGTSSLRRAWARLPTIRPRKLLLPAGGVALAAVAVATAVIAGNEPRSHLNTDISHIEPQVISIEGGEKGDRGAAPAYGETEEEVIGSGHNGHLSQPAAKIGDRCAKGTAGCGASGTFEGGFFGESATSNASPGAPSAATGPYASKTHHRNVERSAEMVLGADPDQVADDAAQVFDAVHAADGIVLSSSVSGGAAGDAGARFELLIPAAKLSDALAAFSAVDTVVSRHEATDDITAPTVRIGEQLRDSRATIDGLLVQLAGADSDEERAEVELELRAERHHNAALRSQAAKLGRRANLSRVSLRIETGSGSASAQSGGGWGIGDALHDAGHILAIAAGVTIVGLAIVGPLALIALLIWLANRARLHRARERTLG